MTTHNEDAIVGDDPTLTADGRWVQVARRRYDPAGEEEFTATVLFAIADATGVSPLELQSPPLCERVDLEALEALFFGSNHAGPVGRSVGVVAFEYDGYRVTIESGGEIRVDEPIDGARR